MATVIPGGITGPTRGQTQMQFAQLLQQGVQAGMQLGEQKRQFDLEQERVKKEFNINKAYDFMLKAGSEHPAGLAGWIGENEKTFSYILNGIGMSPVDTETTYLAIKNQAMTPEQILSMLTANKIELSQGNASGFMKEVKGAIGSKVALDKLRANSAAPVAEGQAPVSEGTATPPSTTGEQPRGGTPVIDEGSVVPSPTGMRGETRSMVAPSSFQGTGLQTKLEQTQVAQQSMGASSRQIPAPVQKKGGVAPAGNMTLKDTNGENHQGYKTNVNGKMYFYEPATDLYYEIGTNDSLSSPLSREDIEVSKEFGLISPEEQRQQGSLSVRMEGLQGVTAMLSSDTPADVDAVPATMKGAAGIAEALNNGSRASDAEIEKAAKAIRMTRKGSNVPQVAVIKKNIKDLGIASEQIDGAIVSGDKGSLNEGIGKYVYNFDKLLSYSDFKELTSTPAGRRDINRQIDQILGDTQTLKMLTLHIEGPEALMRVNSAEALLSDPVYRELQGLETQARYAEAQAKIAQATASLAKTDYEMQVNEYKKSIGYDEKVAYDNLIKSGLSVEQAQTELQLKNVEFAIKAMDAAFKEALGGLDPQVLTQLIGVEKLLSDMYATDPNSPGTPAFKRIEAARDRLYSLLPVDENGEGYIGTTDYIRKARKIIGSVLESFGILGPKEEFVPNPDTGTGPVAPRTKSKEASELDSQLGSELGQ